ncbi:type II toxin-antitoxin system VapC family toxin [uncultured Pseudokineococcus sp.]|uniref:type II toxin-antitoxin system VapC family toxin n=1 Tax=uncultured Pseudokineococcus sp. TaxID=1642928 RepID=UPI002634639E|nr:hypothetical protein [uncultured Pseudokineococcus sp.]
MGAGPTATPRLAVDAPAVLSLLEAGRDPVHPLVGTAALRSQVLDLALGAVRAGHLEETRAMAILEDLTSLRVRLLGDRVSRRTAWRLARAHGWATADAEVVAVALLQADALVSGDARLRALAAGVVRLAPLEALTGLGGAPADPS